jgi:hypothetical protein
MRRKERIKKIKVMLIISMSCMIGAPFRVGKPIEPLPGKCPKGGRVLFF